MSIVTDKITQFLRKFGLTEKAAFVAAANAEVRSSNQSIQAGEYEYNLGKTMLYGSIDIDNEHNLQDVVDHLTSLGPQRLAKAAKKAAKWIRKSALKGYAPGQYLLGGLYGAGLGIEQDDRKCFMFTALAAKQGHIAALSDLGVLCQSGKGCTTDYAEAAKYYQKAVDVGNLAAHVNLAYLYQEGLGVTKDLEKCFLLTQVAAERGFTDAKVNLGTQYAIGQWVEKDLVIAHVWLSIAAESGDADALRRRDIVARRMSPQQIAEAKTLESNRKNQRSDLK